MPGLPFLIAGLAPLAILILASFAGLLVAASGGGRGLADPYIWRITGFAAWQAFLSAVLSVGLAIPVARALARRPAFPGRTVLIRTLGIPMVIPTIVGVLGIVAVFGRSGWVNDAVQLAAPGLRLDIYGLAGILLAHVFFNLPLSIRMLLHGWAGIPAESWRLAGQLGMDGGQVFRTVEWPMIRRIAPGICGLVFLLCFTSFAVVLALGGGPSRATIEVAIYQSLRLDFDLARVALLAGLQLAILGAAVAAWSALSRPVDVATPLRLVGERYDGASRGARFADRAIITGAVIALALPLTAIVLDGLRGPIAEVLSSKSFRDAALRSLAIGPAAGCLSLLMALTIVLGARELRQRAGRKRVAGLGEWLGAAALMMPPLAIGAGLFVLLRTVTDVFAIGLLVVVLVNAAFGVPFGVRLLAPAADRAGEIYRNLADSLGMRGWDRFRLVDWPVLRRPAALALALVSALSLGDLGVIALFGSDTTRTLPLLLYETMGAYRMDRAAVIALSLAAMALGLFFVMERLVGGRERG